MPLPKSGWDVFRDKNIEEVKSDGFTGREIAKQLGEKWRNVTAQEKRHYGLQANFLREINREPEEILERASTVLKYVKPTCLVRRKSF